MEFVTFNLTFAHSKGYEAMGHAPGYLGFIKFRNQRYRGFTIPTGVAKRRGVARNFGEIVRNRRTY